DIARCCLSMRSMSTRRSCVRVWEESLRLSVYLWRYVLQILAAVLAVGVLVTGVWQFTIVKLGHSGCSAKRMEALEPEFGKFDLLPKSFVLIEQSHRTYSALEVFPTDEQGKITGGSLGYYYKYLLLNYR
ncbi:hypothetical protein FOZ63_010290, partial [Perkinsus olseni]